MIPSKNPLADLSEQQLETIEVARRTGVLEKFKECVMIVKGGQAPKSIDRFYVQVMKTAVQKVVPRFALDLFRELSLDGQVQFWVSQGIGFIIADGTVQAFVPTDLVYGGKKNLGGPAHIQTSGDEVELRKWLGSKGKRFTIGQRLDFTATRKKSMGGV